MAATQLANGNSEGVILGQSSTDKVGFFGTTPVVKFATSIALPTSTAVVSISATQWGFTSSAQGLSVLTTLYNLTNAMNLYGLTSSS